MQKVPKFIYARCSFVLRFSISSNRVLKRIPLVSSISCLATVIFPPTIPSHHDLLCDPNSRDLYPIKENTRSLNSSAYIANSTLVATSISLMELPKPIHLIRPIIRVIR